MEDVLKYNEFLESKKAIAPKTGFDVKKEDIHKALKPHQSDIVRWCLKGGCRAIFASFGLGKSVMQIEILKQIRIKEGGRQLVVAPLGVRQEFKRDISIVDVDNIEYMPSLFDFEKDNAKEMEVGG